jgi:transcriptional regulator with XRE-family HTH domain
MKKVGQFLRAKRLEKNYTLENVAEFVGVSINYISKLEKGENSNPSDEIIVKLAKILDIREDELFERFGRIPLATRKLFLNNPELLRQINKISMDNTLSIKQRKLLAEKYIYWYKKISENDDLEGDDS